MKDLFDNNGHITDYGFELLINGEPSELQRLELAEHLDFCDNCIVEYMSKINEDILISPSESIKESVFTKLKKEARKIFFSRYGMVAVAACFTMGVWFTGIFDIERINQDKINQSLAESKVITFVDESNAFLNSFTQKANLFFKFKQGGF